MNEMKEWAMVVFGLLLLISAEVALGEVDNKVIMRVNGFAIGASELAVLPDAMAKDVKPNDEETDQALLRHNTSKLSNRIRQIVLDEAIMKYGITVTDDEIESRVNKSFSAVNITEDVANQIRDKGLRIAQGLKKVFVHELDSEFVYSTYLKDIITSSEWDAYQSNYDTEAKIGLFIDSLPRDVADMKANSRASARRDLEYERLKQRIYSDIMVTDADISFYSQQRLQKNPEEISPELRDTIERRILVERQSEAMLKWWKEQIIAADIEIIDSRFEGIKDAILHDLSVREDPRRRVPRTNRK